MSEAVAKAGVEAGLAPDNDAATPLQMLIPGRTPPKRRASIVEWLPSWDKLTFSNKQDRNVIACCVWLERNNRVFDRVAVMPASVVSHIHAEFVLWKLARARAGGLPGDYSFLVVSACGVRRRR